jgi:hypothetical protein
LRQASQNNVAMHSRSGFNPLLELVQEKSINRSEGWLVSVVAQWKLVRAACVVHMLPYGLRRSTRPLSRPDVAGDPHGQIDGAPARESRLSIQCASVPRILRPGRESDALGRAGRELPGLAGRGREVVLHGGSPPRPYVGTLPYPCVA